MFSRAKEILGRKDRDPPGQQVGFVVACPRSGTTWVKEMLNTHPEIYCTENRFFGGYFDVLKEVHEKQPRFRLTLDRYVDGFLRHFEWRKLGISREQAQRELIAGLSGAVWEFVSRNTSKKVWIDKVTPYPGTALEVVRSLSGFFPGAKVIALIRDGRDVLTSGTFHWLGKKKPGEELGGFRTWRALRFLEGDRSHALPRFFADDEIREWGELWAETSQAISHGSREVSMLNIRYEDLIADPGGSLEKICAHLGAEHSGGILRKCVRAGSFVRMSGGRKPGQADPGAHVRKGIVGDWKNYFTRRDGEEFQRIAGGALKDLGYEADDSWVASLPENLKFGEDQ